MYTILHTGKPYASAIPADAWMPLSKHQTLTAAFKRLLKEFAEMGLRCGSGNWTDHFRIVGNNSIYTREDAVDWRLQRIAYREYQKNLRNA